MNTSRSLWKCTACGKIGYDDDVIIHEPLSDYCGRLSLRIGLLIVFIIIAWLIGISLDSLNEPDLNHATSMDIHRKPLAPNSSTGIFGRLVSAGVIGGVTVAFIWLIKDLFPRSRTEQVHRCATCHATELVPYVQPATPIRTATGYVDQRTQRRVLVGMALFILAIIALIIFARLHLS